MSRIKQLHGTEPDKVERFKGEGRMITRIHKGKWFTVALVAALGALTLSGCKHDPNVQKQKYLESGKRYEKDGKYREAAIQFSNALKVDKNFAPAHYELAKTYLHLGSMIAGYQELQRTVILNPSNMQARLDLGNMLLAGGLPDKAKEQAKAVVAAQPNNAEAYALLAYIAQKQGDHEQGLALIQKAISLDPNHSSFHTALGLMEGGGTGATKAGDSELKKAIELNPKDPNARLAYAQTLARNGDLPGSQQQVESAVKIAPQNLQARIVLAQLYLAQKDQGKAEQTLIQTVTDMPDKDQPAGILLSFYGRTNQMGKAEQTFANLHNSHPKSLPIAAEYARVLIMENKYDPARDILKSLSKTNANNPQVERLNADVLLHDGKPNDAMVLLQKAVGSAPDDVRLRLLLAQTAANLGKTGVAETNLQEAAKLDPRSMEASRGLAELASSRHDMVQLAQVADKAILAHPESPEGYIWRGTAEANQEQMGEADKDYQTALQKDPNNVVASLDLGELRLKQKRVPEGRALLEQVLAREPNQVQALNLLVAADLQDKQPQKALARIQAQIAKAPNNAALYTDLSALQLQMKDFAGAQASAQHALGLNKAYEPAVQMYAEAEVALGNTDAAISAWQQWLNAHPDDPRATMLLGTLEETKGDRSKAIDFYKRALQLDPSQAIAANNLAFLMVENGDNTDVALSYAETARRILPNSPDTADTLAWVYYHKGTYSLARDLLEDALKVEPNNASIHYHLGMTYSKLGNKADAATQLKKASELAPNTQIGKDAETALGRMG